MINTLLFFSPVDIHHVSRLLVAPLTPSYSQIQTVTSSAIPPHYNSILFPQDSLSSSNILPPNTTVMSGISPFSISHSVSPQIPQNLVHNCSSEIVNPLSLGADIYNDNIVVNDQSLNSSHNSCTYQYSAPTSPNSPSPLLLNKFSNPISNLSPKSNYPCFNDSCIQTVSPSLTSKSVIPISGSHGSPSSCSPFSPQSFQYCISPQLKPKNMGLFFTYPQTYGENQAIFNNCNIEDIRHYRTHYYSSDYDNLAELDINLTIPKNNNNIADNVSFTKFDNIQKNDGCNMEIDKLSLSDLTIEPNNKADIFVLSDYIPGLYVQGLLIVYLCFYLTVVFNLSILVKHLFS
jgi:hypothetical protein